MKRALIALGFAVLSACGTLNQSNPTMNVVQGLVAGAPDESTPQVNIAAAISRDFIEAQEVDLMLASIIDRETTAVLVRGGNNGSRLTWLSEDGISVTFDKGVMVASRGLGWDMMGADVSGVHAAFGSPGKHLRRHSYLDGLDQTVVVEYQCTMAIDRVETLTIYEVDHATTVYEEFCDGPDVRFRNLYWRDDRGVIWQSRQWISADTGYLGYQRL